MRAGQGEPGRIGKCFSEIDTYLLLKCVGVVLQQAWECMVS